MSARVVPLDTRGMHGDILDASNPNYLRRRALDLLAEVERLRATLAKVKALELACENYDDPGLDCVTAGPEVFNADACTPCRVWAAIAEGDPS